MAGSELEATGPEGVGGGGSNLRRKREREALLGEGLSELGSVRWHSSRANGRLP